MTRLLTPQELINKAKIYAEELRIFLNIQNVEKKEEISE